MRCSEGTAGLIARIWGRWTTRVLVLVCFSRSHPSSGGGLAEAQRCLDDSFHWSEVPGFPVRCPELQNRDTNSPYDF